MYVVTEKNIHLLLREVGIKQGCGNYKEYERGKKAVARCLWGDANALSNNIQRIIADYVGV